MFSKTMERVKLAQNINFVKTFYYNYKFNLYSLPIAIAPNVYCRISSKAKIKYYGGKLRLGCRWGVCRFYPSEFIISNNATLEIHGDFWIYTGSSIVVDPGAKLSLGKVSGMNLHSRIAVFNSVTIGDHVFISENVTIRDSDNHQMAGSLKKHSAPIIIGNNVWIGINVTIMKGVTIGEGAVVAANSLVNKAVPPNTLVGGVPAKIIRHNVGWVENPPLEGDEGNQRDPMPIIYDP